MTNSYYLLQLHIHGRFVDAGKFWSNPGDYSENDLEWFFENYFKHYYTRIHGVSPDVINITSLEVNSHTKSVHINYNVVTYNREIFFKEKFYYRYSLDYNTFAIKNVLNKMKYEKEYETL